MINLNPSQQKLLNFIKEYAHSGRTDGVVQKDLGKEIGLAYNTVKSAGSALEEMGMIKKIRKPGRRMHFILLFKNFA